MVAAIISLDAVPTPSCCSLVELANGQSARVLHVEPHGNVPQEFIARLGDLGFIPGEYLRVVARGPFGNEPIAVRLGTATFALRRVEAQCILVTQDE